MATRKGLGKGLDSLIPAKPVKTEKPVAAQEKPVAAEDKTIPAEKEQHAEVECLLDINKVEPDRKQPRSQFDEESLLELAESIKQFGIIQPLIVQKKEKYYEIIAGERRWRAAKIAGLKKVPVLIRDYSDQERIEIALIENIQRENLNPIEEAMAYKRLLNEFHLKQEEVALRVSKSRSAVTNSMRLLKLDDRVQQMLIDEMLTTGHARSLLAVEDGNAQYELANRIYDENLNVRDTEKLIQKTKSIKPKKTDKTSKSLARTAAYEDMEERLKQATGTKVSVHERAHGKGKIEIEYYSEEDLDRLFSLILGNAQSSYE